MIATWSAWDGRRRLYESVVAQMELAVDNRVVAYRHWTLSILVVGLFSGIRMTTLTEKLISILERDRGGPKKEPDDEKSNTSIPIPDQLRYAIGTVFARVGTDHHYSHILPDCAAIIVRTRPEECVLVCLPSGNRWSDGDSFIIKNTNSGPTKEEFHRAFGSTWEVSRRGKEALEEWSRADV